MRARYKDSKGQPLYCGDIVLLEVNIDEPIKRLEYIEDISNLYEGFREIDVSQLVILMCNSL